MAKESLYRQCVKALESLLGSPSEEHNGVFTEIDIIQRAATPDWTEKDYKAAIREANAVAGTYYRYRKLCRYGPIVLEDGSEDYARIGGKIVYGDAEKGPKVWKTPNGRFPRLMLEEDSLGRQGRRAGTERNDAEDWNGQSIHSAKVIRNHSAYNDAKLLKKVEEALRRIDGLEKRERQREQLFSEMAR